MNKYVTFVKMHTTTFIPGIGNIDATLPSQSKTFENLTMVTEAAGVVVSCRVGGRNKSFLIPYTQCQALELGEDVASEHKAPKSVKVA